jgi:hypothetical protein
VRAWARMGAGRALWMRLLAGRWRTGRSQVLLLCEQKSGGRGSAAEKAAAARQSE